MTPRDPSRRSSTPATHHPTVALVIIGDGRDEYHERSVTSAKQHLPLGDFAQQIIVDDREHRLGFAGAIQHAWDQVESDFVFHLEADFTFNAPVPLQDMLLVLEANTRLAQLVLKRQPWNDMERAAGGIIEQHPSDYETRRVTMPDGREIAWTEHRRFFSTNPSLYSSRLCRLRWPQEPRSGGVFSQWLLADPMLRFAFWGAAEDPPLVHHIGDERAGTGY